MNKSHAMLAIGLIVCIVLGVGIGAIIGGKKQPQESYSSAQVNATISDNIKNNDKVNSSYSSSNSNDAQTASSDAYNDASDLVTSDDPNVALSKKASKDGQPMVWVKDSQGLPTFNQREYAIDNNGMRKYLGTLQWISDQTFFAENGDFYQMIRYTPQLEMTAKDVKSYGKQNLIDDIVDAQGVNNEA